MLLAAYSYRLMFQTLQSNIRLYLEAIVPDGCILWKVQAHYKIQDHHNNKNKEGFLHISAYGKTMVFLEVMINYSGFLYIPCPTIRKSDPQQSCLLKPSIGISLVNSCI